MSTRGNADVVFCLDASGSMRPCLNGVKQHVGSFVEGFGAGLQAALDVRMDFVAHNTSGGGILGIFPSAPFQLQHRSVHEENLQKALYPESKGSLFTRDAKEFSNKLARISPGANEASLVALDFALDFPWRPSSECHRVVVMLTDEPFEGGGYLKQQRAKLNELIDKIHALRVELFLVTPESPVFEQLGSADKCTHEIVNDRAGLKTVDFRSLLEQIGKTVSVSRLQGSDVPVARGLFGQASW